jgi:hypothetical protein
MTFRTEEALNQYNAHANHQAAVESWKSGKSYKTEKASCGQPR